MIMGRFENVGKDALSKVEDLMNAAKLNASQAIPTSTMMIFPVLLSKNLFIHSPSKIPMQLCHIGMLGVLYYTFYFC